MLSNNQITNSKNSEEDIEKILNDVITKKRITANKFSLINLVKNFSLEGSVYRKF